VTFLSSLAVSILSGFGRACMGFARHIGQISLLTLRIVVSVFQGGVSAKTIFAQAYEQGIGSLPLVLVTAVLSGIVTSQQGGYQFSSSIPLYVLGSVVASSVVLELGPVMTAFVLIGRVGARITAEIGTMAVSEQVDALISLGRDPVPFLAAPRVIAGMVVTPILVGVANAVGVLTGLVSARATMGLGPEGFLYGARMYWHSWDLLYSLTKAFVFGFMIPVISVHMGLITHGGAEGVGRNTTTSVVFMIITVLVVDATFPPLFLN
jgi:phospholipid/cholesterol/gamma-HCH transport system permease protein